MALRKGGGVYGPKKKPKPKPARGTTFKPPSRPQSPVVAPPKPPPAAAGIAYSPPGYSGGTGGYDVGSDPAVAAAQGLAAKIRANAQATALAKRKQAAIEYGDPTGVEGIDDATAQAARDNPFSSLKNIEHTHDVGVRDLEEQLNSSNLFYSGYRGQQLGEAARDYQNQRYQAGSAFRGLMGDINDQLAQALLSADQYEASSLMGSDSGSYGYGDYGAGGGIYPNASGSYATGLRNALVGPRTGPAPYVTGTSSRPKPKPKPATRPGGYGAGYSNVPRRGVHR